MLSDLSKQSVRAKSPEETTEEPRLAIETDKIRKGDNDAFDSLYGEYAPRVLAFFLRLTPSRAEAEDLTQETFLAAYSGRASFQGKAKILTWLLAIAHRRFRDRVIRPKNLTTVNREEIDEASYSVGDHAQAVSIKVTLASAMDCLDTKERLILTLTAIQGLTFTEAATVLGEPVGTLKWRASEATRKLRTILTKQEAHDKQNGI